MKYLSTRLALFTALLLASSTASAHTALEKANPPVGSTVAQPPSEVVLWFTEKIEPAFSTIEVRNASGSAVSVGRALAGSNRTQLRLPLKTLATGTYKVIWRVLSVDTHRAQGDFTFRVGP